jgi:hypothetical protein
MSIITSAVCSGRRQISKPPLRSEDEKFAHPFCSRRYIAADPRRRMEAPLRKEGPSDLPMLALMRSNVTAWFMCCQI